MLRHKPTMVSKTDSPRQVTLMRLIWGLRCIGVFCFKISSNATSSAEICHLSLLWALFIWTYSVTLSVPITIKILTSLRSLDVGTTTTYMTSWMAKIFYLMSEITLLINGPILCQIISECREIAPHNEKKRSSLSWRVFSVERIMTLLFYCSYAASISSSLNTLWLAGDFSTIETVAVIMRFLQIKLSEMLIPIMFRKLLTTASASLSVDHPQDDSFLQGSDAGTDLKALESTIHKVSDYSKPQSWKMHSSPCNA